jgi:hypothetical protein
MNLELCKFENIKESDKNFRTLYVIFYLHDTFGGLINVTCKEIYLQQRNPYSLVMRISLEPS